MPNGQSDKRYQVIIWLDVCRSTELVNRLGPTEAYRRIDAAITSAVEYLRKVDPNLRQDQARQGDGLFLLGDNSKELYLRADKYQAIYRNHPYGREPITFTIGCGEIETVTNSGLKENRGVGMHFVHRLSKHCPPMRVAVTSQIYEQLKTQGGYHHRFEEQHVQLDGFPEEKYSCFISLYEATDTRDSAPPSEQPSMKRRKVRSSDTAPIESHGLSRLEIVQYTWLASVTLTVFIFWLFGFGK